MTLQQLRQILGREAPPSCDPPIARDPEIERDPEIAGDPVITGITEDSRRVTHGAVFVAARGVRADGHDFVRNAVQAGAVAVIGDRTGLTEIEGVPYFAVESPRRALGLVAHALAGDPSKALTVIGITGTNGKSSSVALCQHVLDTCGFSAATFGTLGYTIAGTTIPAPHTTPFGEDLAEMFRRARDARHTHVVMEVSSHALEQERVAGIDFDVALFTNLTQDHLDYHKDMNEYRRAKLRLFEAIAGPGRFTVVNRDDPSADAFIEASGAPCYTFSRNPATGADCVARGIQVERTRTSFKACTPWGKADITMRLVGVHNVSNALGVIAVCAGLKLPLEGIAEGIASVASVPGRFEHVDAGQDFQVIVDYAHTEDGLRNVLRAARQICRGTIILVFGCGGDRDKGKRPKMAMAAAEVADRAIITSDNPRTEDPERILLDIEVGMQHAGKKKYEYYDLMLDRAEAIRRAIETAKPGDLVLIAGKGHEDYQILGAKRIHFDDREVARAVLSRARTARALPGGQ